MLVSVNNLFPLWALLVSAIAFFFNAPFSALNVAIIPLLATIMFMMGLTLSKEDFKRIALDPKPVIVGVLLQFLLMPILALTFSKMLQLSNQLTIGMVLVGSCAGGTASNVICYLAKGDVALSISMTMISTLVGVIATPLLCSFYLSETISIDTWALLLSILQMVFIPALLGFSCKLFFSSFISKIEKVIPTLSILMILMIIAIVVALNASRLLEIGLVTFVAVALHNLSGLVGGFYISRLLGINLQQHKLLTLKEQMLYFGRQVTTIGTC